MTFYTTKYLILTDIDKFLDCIKRFVKIKPYFFSISNKLKRNACDVF